jgi:2,4-dienoyl-CoA reductase-like NADH-dependent reductase (Old Yellow Enzyme family)
VESGYIKIARPVESHVLVEGSYTTLTATGSQPVLITTQNLTMSSLLEPIAIGGGKLALRNRVVMGALTRNRCVDDMKPGQAQIDHYSQRAKDGTGLIISEGVFIDWTGSHWTNAPVMISEDHCKAWQKVVDGVHQAGGKMFFQPWHAGKTNTS